MAKSLSSPPRHPDSGQKNVLFVIQFFLQQSGFRWDDAACRVKISWHLFFIYPGLGKDSSPASSLHIRPKEPKKFVTPSPGAYNPENADKEVKASSAKFSFGIKSEIKNVSDSPGTSITKQSKFILKPAEW